MSPEATTAAPTKLDVSALPLHAFGHRAPLWWGVLLLVAIESTAMGILLVSYFYLRGNYDVWPPVFLGRPVLLLAGPQAALLGASMIPMMLSVRAARQKQLGPTRDWLVAATVLGTAMLILRGFELARIPFRWDETAYG